MSNIKLIRPNKVSYVKTKKESQFYKILRFWCTSLFGYRYTYQIFVSQNLLCLEPLSHYRTANLVFLSFKQFETFVFNEQP